MRDLQTLFFLSSQWVQKVHEFSLSGIFLAAGFGEGVAQICQILFFFLRLSSEKSYNQTSDLFFFS